jgi:hypothetical protein
MIKRENRILFLVVLLWLSAVLQAQKPVPVIVNIDNPGAVVKPTMWGIFFEDINFVFK